MSHCIKYWVSAKYYIGMGIQLNIALGDTLSTYLNSIKVSSIGSGFDKSIWYHTGHWRFVLLYSSYKYYTAVIIKLPLERIMLERTGRCAKI